MLKIIKSGFNACGRESLKKQIVALVAQYKRSYLIVPEQQTVMAEAEMAEYLPDFAPTCFEATNFTRFANTGFRMLGGVSGEYCDKAKKALIMWRTLTELSPVLTLTSGRKEISAGLVETALSAITDMQVQGISAEDVAACAEAGRESPDRRLMGKLTDLSRIYSLYKSLLSERYADTGDDIDMLVDKLEGAPEFFSDCEIFIEGFTSFTEPQYKLISELICRTSVTVHLTIPKAAADGFEYTELRLTEERLKSIARKRSVTLKVSSEDGKWTKSGEALSQISDRMFRNYPNFDNITLQNTEELRIVEARTPFDMCDFIADDIKRRVMSGGRYSDFAIVCRRAESYNGILDTALERAALPAFFSKESDLSSFEAIKLIYTAYAIVKGGFSRESVLTYAKCSMSGITRSECDRLEMYVEKWQINGRKFTDEAPWNMNPLGYSTVRPEGTDEKLAEIHQTRMKLITPLIAFDRGARAAKTVKEHAMALLELLTTIDLEGSLMSKAAQLEALGEADYARDNGRLWKLICDSLDTLVEVSGDCPADSESFLGQLKILLSFARINSIPSHKDEITVGSADMLRLYGKKHVYLIGVNAGEFPMAATDTAFFSERDKIALAELGLGVKPEMEIRSAKELYFFARAFTYAEETVTLVYSACDTKFKASARAEVIDKIIKLTGESIKVIKTDKLSADDTLWSATGALEQLASLPELQRQAAKEALIRSGHPDKVRISEADVTNPDMALGREICDKTRDRVLKLSQSRLDSYLSCPLNYFCRYTVRLGTEEKAEFDAAGIGSFIHSILENFFRALRDRNMSVSDLTSDDKERLTKKAAEKYLSELGELTSSTNALTRIKIERLCRAAMPVVDGLCDEFSDSKFIPTFFELSLTGGEGEDSPGAINLYDEEAGKISIRGIVDRVDTYKQGNDVFVRVVDYKTGKKSFDPTDLAEGRNLQMFLYLDAIVNSKSKGFCEAAGVEGDGRLHPAGVSYLKTAIGDTRINLPDDAMALEEVKEAQEREGMVLDNDEVIGAMGLRYTPLYSKRSPDKISDTKKKYLFTEEGWDSIMETVRSSATKIASGIRSGSACATPTVSKDGSTHCEWCDYKPICRKAVIKK